MHHPDARKSSTRPEADPTEVVLEVRNLSKHFGGGSPGRNGQAVRAVDGATFAIERGETFGLVGESGSGKTTLGQTILRLYQPTSGQIVFNDVDISTMQAGSLRNYRQGMQMIFQNPSASLDPRLTVGANIEQLMNIYGIGTKLDRLTRVRDLLHAVGLDEYFANRYLNEVSAGQRQRIGVARSLVLGPDLIVCDEPVSTLDVSLQAHVLNLLRVVQAELSISYLFIAHKPSVVARMADRIGVMSNGRLVEVGPAESILDHPRHAATRALVEGESGLAATSRRSRGFDDRANGQSGYRNSRYNPENRQCTEQQPQLQEVSPGHWVASHHAM